MRGWILRERDKGDIIRESYRQDQGRNVWVLFFYGEMGKNRMEEKNNREDVEQIKPNLPINYTQALVNRPRKPA